MSESHPTYLTPAQSHYLSDVARYQALGLTHRQARLLAKLDAYKENGTGTMLLICPAGLTWQFWRVTPDGLIGE